MATKILIVLDGGYRFANGATPGGTPDFTYATLVDTLTGAGFEVTKAHRGADSTATLGWTLFQFNAVPAGNSLLDFSAIWLIGLNGKSVQGDSVVTGALPDPELTAIANYMDAGGGVFATGDHYSLGAELSGKIPRVRAMRCWYGDGDPAGNHMPAGFRNFPPLTTARADTTRTNPAGSYGEFAAPFIWFENQSDQIPQALTHIAPTHPILRRGENNILVYPDHMHEGNTLGEVAGYSYAQNSPYGDTSKHEFREISGHREPPRVIATGQGLANASRRATSPTGAFSFAGFAGAEATAAAKTVNTLSVYDGRVAGVGRIVTGATFHHYVDINLNGDSSVTSAQAITRAGVAAQDNRGFNDDMTVFNDIKTVFVNITNWLVRPKPTIQLILERSTFSQGEAPSGTEFAGAVLVTIDGLKPNQFPGGPPVLGAIGAPASWVPQLTVSGSPISIEPMSVSTDDPGMPDRLQRFTFVYRVRFTGNAFGFSPEEFSNVTVNASFPSGPVSPALADSAFLQLVKSANPFMLDLADGNATSWLSSDLKVFRLVEGEDVPGLPGTGLPTGASRAQALSFIRSLANNVNTSQFTGLSGVQSSTALSLLPRTTATNKAIYNFALARVRLNSNMPDADDVRVFFRIFTTLTTAALTYRESAPGVPIEGYAQTGGANPIALPGKVGAEWVSFPFFAADRASTPTGQSDPDNVEDILNTEDFKFFGALLDSNLDDEYPGLVSAPPQPIMRSLFNGPHHCMVAQIEFAGTPIPDGATPWTSDKLSQRNIAFVTVANPGLDASRAASHTFEIEATPHPVTESMWPDELLLDWPERTPDGTLLRIHIPSWNAEKVVELANLFYSRHEIEAVDDHTIEMMSGGTRYLPLPQSLHRQTGVITVEFPLGIKKGQRFDLSVRQVSNRGRGAKVPQPQVETITLEEADRLLEALPRARRNGGMTKDGKGTFDLGENRVLITDLSVFDTESDRAMIIDYPEPSLVEAAYADRRQWRETIGAFQLGMPVSTKKDMLLDEMRLLSVMRWRVAYIEKQSRWRKTLIYYVGLLADKVQALGGNPFEVPATPDGAIPQLPWVDSDGDGVPDGGIGGVSGSGDLFDPANPFTRGCIVGLAIALLLLIALLAIYMLWG